MPELPDITVYVEALERRIADQPLQALRIFNTFLLRSVDPPIDSAAGRTVQGVRRLGKRIVLALEGDLFVIFHLMIAGRLRWEDRVSAEGDRHPRKPGSSSPDARRERTSGPGSRRDSRTSNWRMSKIVLASLEFPTGTLLLTEAGTKKRASLHLVRGANALAAHDPGGIEVLDADEAAFRAALMRENHTLKRALTDPRLFSGIGNAYSDEILHAAGLSPVKLTSKLSDSEIVRLLAATRDTLSRWTERLLAQFAGRFPGPGEITAFRPDFAVHGRFGKPCPVCGSKVQRIRYAENETNYCPRCQTEGRVLADRSLSRLLKSDWPKMIDELESR